MTLTVGTNTYVDGDDAATYAEGSLRMTGWGDLDTDVQERALIAATRILQRRNWAGERTDGAQALAHPRTGMTDREGQPVDSAVVHPDIIAAEVELAWDLSQTPTLEAAQDVGGGNQIKEVQAGPARVLFFHPAGAVLRFSQPVLELIAPFLGAVSGSWGSYNASDCNQSTTFGRNNYGLTGRGQL